MENEIMFLCAVVSLSLMLVMSFRLYQLSKEIGNFYKKAEEMK